MNVAQIIARTCAQLGQEALEQDERELALAYIGEAYEELMRVYRPYAECVMETQDGRLTAERLGEDGGRVTAVLKDGREIPFRREAGDIHLGFVQGPVVVRRRYVPGELLRDGEVPQLPAAYHGALSDYATWRLMGNGGKARQQRGEMYFSRYLQRRATLAPESAAWRDSILYKYG